MATKTPVGIIGLGKFGFSFAKALAELNQATVGVDKDPENVKYARNVLTHVYHAEVTDKEVLQQIGFGELSTVLVSVGDSITASSMISMYLKEMKIPSVWVKAVSVDHKKLLHRIGVHRVIIPEAIAAEQLANRLAMPGFIDYLPFEKDVIIKEIAVKNWVGKSLKEIDLTNKHNVQVIAFKKPGDGRFRFIPKANNILEEDEILIVIGKVERVNEIDP